MISSALPKISIIIGVLNMKHHLAKTLDSVIAQNYPNLELIIMDGGSTDGTLAVIKDYREHITHWKSEKDKGHADACNKAIDMASGDLIHFLNADDFLSENLLHDVARTYQRNPGALVITTAVKIVKIHPNSNQMTIIQEINKESEMQISLKNMLFNLPIINARFFHPTVFKEFGKFQATHPDGSYNLSNDRDFLLRLALANIQSAIVSESFYYYLSHDDSLTFGQKNIFKSYHEHLKLAKKFLTLCSLSPTERNLLSLWRTKEAIHLALRYIKTGRLLMGLKIVKNHISIKQSMIILLTKLKLKNAY